MQNEEQYTQRYDLDFETKVSKYYDDEKMRSAIMNMEQFYALAHDKTLSEKEAICAYRLFEHYRRLAMCILMKDFSPDFNVDLVITSDYMNKLFKNSQDF